jgi:hypothetical protein
LASAGQESLKNRDFLAGRKVSVVSVWDDILARIETKVNRHSFYTWFRPTSFVAEDRLSVTGSGAEPALQGLAHETLRRE